MLPDTTSAPAVRSLLASSLPDLSTKKLRLVLAGEDFDTWEVDGAVVKFPKTPSTRRSWIGRWPSRICSPSDWVRWCPAVRAVAAPVDGFPYCSVVFERARGRPGQTAEGQMVRPKPWARTSLARDVAAALSMLHTTPLKRVRAAGAKKRPLDLDAMMDIDQEAITRASRVAGNAVDRFLVDPLPAAARASRARGRCATAT